MTNEERIAASIQEYKATMADWQREMERLREEYRASVTPFNEEDFMNWVTERIIEQQDAEKERKRLLREITHIAEDAGTYD